MDEKPHIFELSGTRFRGAFLAPDKSLECLTILGPAIAEVIGKLPDGKGDEIEAFKQIAGAVFMRFESLPKASKFFVPAYEVEVEHGEGKAWLPLNAKQDIFQGKALLFVAFLITAIKKEYGDFLQGSGLSMLQDLGGALGFLKK